MVTNPVKVIREKCKDCCCGNVTEVAECTAVNCALHPFRFGKNPYRRERKLTEEERAMVADRLSKGRKNARTTIENHEDSIKA